MRTAAARIVDDSTDPLISDSTSLCQVATVARSGNGLHLATSIAKLPNRGFLPELAIMDLRQQLLALLPLDLNVRARIGRDDAVQLRIDDRRASFRVVHMGWLITPAAVRGLVSLHHGGGLPLLVTYSQSNGDARVALRAAGVSYAGADGRVFLRAPGLYVERDDRVRPRDDDSLSPERSDSTRNPFAGRASRVPRWLLLHHQAEFTQSEIARHVDLSASLVSRTVRALEDDGYAVSESAPSRHRRAVRVHNPRLLLDEWASRRSRRKLSQLTWDVGARDAESVLEVLSEVAPQLPARSWALGGLAGAALVVRSVEPSEVLVWTKKRDMEALAAELQPRPGRRGRGALRVAVDPDPWPLELARVGPRGLPIADPVQLYLDCVREGERAFETAEAIAGETGW